MEDNKFQANRKEGRDGNKEKERSVGENHEWEKNKQLRAKMERNGGERGKGARTWTKKKKHKARETGEEEMVHESE